MNRYLTLIILSAISFSIVAHNTVVTHPKITESGLELLIKSDSAKQYEELYQPLYDKKGRIFVVLKSIQDDGVIVRTSPDDDNPKIRPIYQFWGFNPRIADDDLQKLIEEDDYGCFDLTRIDTRESIFPFCFFI